METQKDIDKRNKELEGSDIEYLGCGIEYDNLLEKYYLDGSPCYDIEEWKKRVQLLEKLREEIYND
jgi:hypothetical protein